MNVRELVNKLLGMDPDATIAMHITNQETEEAEVIQIDEVDFSEDENAVLIS